MADYRSIDSDQDIRNRGKATKKAFNRNLPISPDNQPPAPDDDYQMITGPGEDPIGPQQGHPYQSGPGWQPSSPAPQQQPSDADLLNTANGSSSQLRNMKMPPAKKKPLSDDDIDTSDVY